MPTGLIAPEKESVYKQAEYYNSEATMCQQCVDACREIFPEVSDDEMGGFLLETTCFPFGSPKQVREQLVENKRDIPDDKRTAD